VLQWQHLGSFWLNTIMPDRQGRKQRKEWEPMSQGQDQVKTNFWNSLAGLLQDLTSLEVATFTTTGGITLPNITDALDKLNVGNAPLQLQAYSRFDLDQDTKVILPVKQVGEDLVVQQAILDIHEKHVTTALAQRSAMIASMLKAITDILGIP
jgi:hypothetical protein